MKLRIQECMSGSMNVWVFGEHEETMQMVEVLEHTRDISDQTTERDSE